MNAIKVLIPSLLSVCCIVACNNKKAEPASVGVADTTLGNPTTNALDYNPDQRQTIPKSDSSNTVGTDTINSSVATPNTGTMKSYNDKKGSKDSMK
ncbi:MAG: hypothetical protein ABJB05_06120 [Parafilimonas sp.]